MDRADICRRAARDAVSDVEPPQLYDLVGEILAESSMVPAVFTLETASELGSYGDREAIARQAAGVQLIYEGLRLTRTLAHTEPWADHEDDTAVAGDLEILAADILVARGFYLLARTDAAGKAVRTVQEFGRHETDRVGGGHADADSASMEPTPAERDDPDTVLERNILELAALTGAAAVEETPTESLLSLATEIAESAGPSFPPVGDCFPPLECGPADGLADDGSNTDRATSVSDP